MIYLARKALNLAKYLSNASANNLISCGLNGFAPPVLTPEERKAKEAAALKMMADKMRRKK